MCATPSNAYDGNSENPLAATESTVVLRSGAFALERVNPAIPGLDLRPTWHLDKDTRLSLKVNKHQTELGVKWQW